MQERSNFQKEKDEIRVKVHYAGESMEKITYEEAFFLDADLIVSLEFPNDWICEVGSYHQDIVFGREYELLCRILEKKEMAIIIPAMEEKEIQNSNQEEHNEGIALTYAYVVRHHMDMLHARKKMDSVFQGICLLLQKKGCFAQFQQYLNFFLSDADAYERFDSKTAPFLVLRGDATCGGLLQQFSDELAECLAANGQAVLKYSGENEIDGSNLDEFAKKNWKGIIGFQSPALEIPFFRKLHGPKFQYWFDNPLVFKDILRDLPDDYMILCQDGDHAKWIQKYYHTNAIQFPPGGMEMQYMNCQRTMDLIFVGSLFPDQSDALNEQQKMFYQYMVQHPTLNFEQGLLCFVKEVGMEGLAKRVDLLKDGKFAEEWIPELMYEYRSACRAVIGYFRRKIVETILDAGITLHVYGDDWAFYQGSGRERLIIHPTIPVRDSLQEFQKAKIALNIMSWHKAGMTERVANIMLSGAVCVSDETKFLRENVKDGEEMILFRLDALECLPDKIRQLLQNDEQRDRIAKNAYDRAKRDFSWDARAKKLIELAEISRRQKEKINIYVCTHVKFNPPNAPIYIPLHVGRKGKQNLGYIGDDTGENISDLNYLYGELTGLFWIWQNVNDVDYVGMCHYRRYFISDDLKELQEKDYLELLHTCDAIVPRHMECVGKNYYEHFGRAHNSRDLDAVEHALKKLYPEYGPAYDQAMSGKIFYWGNLVVTSLPILKAYAEWLFTIFVEAGEEIDVSEYDDYHKRVYGFLSEQMFYVFALANELKLAEVAVGISAEKAETEELKNTVKGLIAAGKRKEALKLIENRLKNRPDLLLQGSDVNGELKAVYEELKKG